jgi:hypothetical protein
MTNKKRKNTHGWLPEDPIRPQKTYSKPTLPTPLNHTFARIGGTVLSAIGVFLISVYSFGYFFFGYSNSGLDTRLLFYGTYVLGIGITITGLTLRQRFTGQSYLIIKKPSFLAGGIACLSVSVVGSLISAEMIIQFAMTHTVEQYYGASWWNHPFSGAVSFWVVGFAGWIILLWERKGAEWSPRVKAMFNVLSAGVLLLFVNALTQALILAAQSANPIPAQLVSFNNFLAVPIGTLLLTCGWIFLLITSLKIKTKSGDGKSI